MTEQDPVHISDDTLTRLGLAAARQLKLERRLQELTDQSTVVSSEIRRLSEVDIPSILDETGLSEVRLKDGTKVVVKEDLRVSTTGKYREMINAWLVKTGNEDMIKDEVVARFGKGEGDKAAAFLAAALAETEDADRKRSVNPQSFAALLREMMSNGDDVPLDELGAFVQRRAKLEPPK